MKIVKKIALVLILLIVFFGFQILGGTSHYHISVPTLQEKSSTNCLVPLTHPDIYLDNKQFPQGCNCTKKGVNAEGFPFRSNLYDACQQDEKNIVPIAVVNYCIQAGLLVLLFLFLRPPLAPKSGKRV